MRAARVLTPLLAGATVILLAANAWPAMQRKQRLIRERERLVRELDAERERARDLQRHLDAIRHDHFYLKRLLAETWRGVPVGSTPLPSPKSGPTLGLGQRSAARVPHPPNRGGQRIH